MISLGAAGEIEIKTGLSMLAAPVVDLLTPHSIRNGCLALRSQPLLLTRNFDEKFHRPQFLTRNLTHIKLQTLR